MYRILVTLTIAEQHEESLVDFLLDSPRPPQQISFLTGHAIGPDIPLVTAHERVKGRARRAIIQFVDELESSRELIKSLESSFTGKCLHYRLAPILDSGVLP